MKKITKEAVNALKNGKNYQNANTLVVKGKMYLFDNLIAEKTENGLFINSCGWRTNTTKERLNGLEGVLIIQRNFKWYLNGQEWNGKKIKI